jgi:thiamine biosynthesis lipoprotein
MLTIFALSVIIILSPSYFWSENMKKVIFALLAAVLAAALIIPAALRHKNSAAPYISGSQFLLDTTCTIRLYDKQDKALLDEAFDLIARYESLWSKTIPTSDISRINSAGSQPVEVDPETVSILKTAVEYSALSGGVFDVTIGALAELWDVLGELPQIPDEADIEKARETVDYTGIVLNGSTVKLENPDARLDLGGIAKGYIADRVRDFLVSRGVGSAIINLGGNVVVIGSNPKGSPWTVGVQAPFEDSGDYVGTLHVSDKSVVTSGIYRRYFVLDGVLYTHIIDPRTGRPVENDLASVTIISPRSQQGDGIASACLLLGVEMGKELIGQLEGVSAIFVKKDGTVILTEDFPDDAVFVPTQGGG